jgi:flagellar hook-associated protein 3 FlgL
MSLVTFGDAAQFLSLRRDSADTKTDIHRLTAELSSGKHADLGRALGGNFSTLSDITRSLRLNASFTSSVADAAIAAEGRQTALGRLEAEVDGFGPEILAVSGGGSLSDLQLTLANGTDRFESAVNTLNTRLAGRSLFSADAPDQTPLISGEDMMVDLRALVAGATDAATIEADVTAWFQDIGGGYETTAWQGGNGQPPAILLAEGQSANTGITALDPAIREALTGLAIVALASENAVPLAEAEQRALVTGAAQTMINATGSLISLRANLGSEEARIEEARVTAQTTKSALEIEYNGLTAADPYDTATELEAATTRLESLYILTARMSRLSLTEYLR